MRRSPDDRPGPRIVAGKWGFRKLTSNGAVCAKRASERSFARCCLPSSFLGVKGACRKVMISVPLLAPQFAADRPLLNGAHTSIVASARVACGA